MKCAALRKLLGDYRWHTQQELMAVGGMRYGGRLLEIRRGYDGGVPLNVQSKCVSGDGSVWRYRAVRT